MGLYGLVLAGGRSRRMGRDKGSLDHGGLSQARWTAALLARHCGPVFFSCRPDQVDAGWLGGYPKIPDAFGDAGPLGAIASALSAQPGATFLVAACDLPRLGEGDIAALARAAAERPERAAIAFRHGRAGRIEPLCAIYRPACLTPALDLLAAHGGAGARDRGPCPKALLERVGAAWLDAGPGLANCNTPEEWARALGEVTCV